MTHGLPLLGIFRAHVLTRLYSNSVALYRFFACDRGSSSPYINRFLQPDSIIPGAANPQSWNRYSYVKNNPISYNDPSGHRDVETNEGGGGSCNETLKKSKPPCARKPTTDARKDLDNLPLSTYDYHNTYAVANIALQKGPPNKATVWLGGVRAGDPRYASKGPAKVTDAEMEEPYGKAINDGDNNYGLGLRTPGATFPDQNDVTVAFQAMTTRIQVRLDKCKDTRFPCTPTDIFLASAVGGDDGMGPGDLRDLGNGAKRYGKPNPDGIFAWGEYLDQHENTSHNLSVIQQFVDNVAYLHDKGAAIPSGIDWTYICDLLK